MNTVQARLNQRAAIDATRVVSVTLQPLHASLACGDRLRISVAAAAWPAIVVNPGHGAVPCGAPSPEHRVVTLTLKLAGSTLQLNPFDSGRLKLD